MLLRLKRLACLHKPEHTIQDAVNEWGFGPNCAAVSYATRCAKCGAVIDIKWLRPNVELLQPPVLDHVPVYVVNARVHPTFGTLLLPFSTYIEVVEGNH